VDYRNLQATYWASYWEELRNKFVEFVVQFGTVEANEIVVELLQ
jgi:hypothetical protein